MVYVTAVIMTTSYAATFISFLAVRRYKLPFEDFEGLLKDGSYRLGLNRATGHLHLFQDSDDPLMRQIYTDLIEPEVRSNALPQTDLEGLRKLCDESKYSFLTLDTSLKGLEKEIPCNIVAIPRAFHTTTLSMLISKSSSYRTLFTDHMQEIRRTGLVKRSVDRTWPTKPNELLQEPAIVVSSDLLVLLASGITAALLLLTLELGWRRMSSGFLS
ncbi:uncharacterized protein LOC111869631 isoform X2 [Cryptotermes secundus]|nr:uncharacterized protein LOC111869631 isoform X2 [Cryptotermes secundus]